MGEGSGMLFIYTLCSGFYQNPLIGVLAIFLTGTYAGIGTWCVEFEICYDKYHKKNIDRVWLKHSLNFK